MQDGSHSAAPCCGSENFLLFITIILCFPPLLSPPCPLLTHPFTGATRKREAGTGRRGTNRCIIRPLTASPHTCSVPLAGAHPPPHCSETGRSTSALKLPPHVRWIFCTVPIVSSITVAAMWFMLPKLGSSRPRVPRRVLLSPPSSVTLPPSPLLLSSSLFSLPQSNPPPNIIITARLDAGCHFRVQWTARTCAWLGMYPVAPPSFQVWKTEDDDPLCRWNLSYNACLLLLH